MLLKRRMLFAFARAKGDAGVTCRLKIRLATHHGIDFLGQMMMPWIKQPLPPETNIGAAVICAEKAVLPKELKIGKGIKKGAANLSLAIGLSPADDIDGALDRLMKGRLTLPFSHDIKCGHDVRAEA